jgi:hypothetical protein
MMEDEELLKEGLFFLSKYIKRVAPTKWENTRGELSLEFKLNDDNSVSFYNMRMLPIGSPPK